MAIFKSFYEHKIYTQMINIKLRPSVISDLESLFDLQLDKESGYMAAFMPSNHTDQSAYIDKYTKLFNDPNVTNLTILIDNIIIGSVAKFIMNGEAEITYWIDRKYWGQGIATHAVKSLLDIEMMRPIFAHVAFDNFGSQKVLENCGFERIGSDHGFASARQEEIEEFIYRLDE
jgi:RimJ/RimL family protein N-acetyltransferase